MSSGLYSSGSTTDNSCLLKAWEASRGWLRCLGPCIHMGDLEDALSSWLLRSAQLWMLWPFEEWITGYKAFFFVSLFFVMLPLKMCTIKWIESLCAYKMLHMEILMAALFITVKTWKQQRCAAAGDYMSKIWYIQTIEYHLITEKIKHGLLSHEGNGQTLTTYFSVRRSQCEKATYYMIAIIWHSGKGKIIGMIKRLMADKVLRQEGVE